MFTRKTIPFIVGSILLVAVAFLFLTHQLNWRYVSDLYKDKDEPAIIVETAKEPWQTVKLDVAVSLNEQQYEELLELSDVITEQYPQLDVYISNHYEQYSGYEEWETLARLGELGDIQLVPNEWVVPLAIQGMYQPVDRLINNEVLSDQLPGIVDALKWNGYMWAVPYESNPYLLFIHQQAVDWIEQNANLISDSEQADQLIEDVTVENPQEDVEIDELVTDNNKQDEHLPEKDEASVHQESLEHIQPNSDADETEVDHNLDTKEASQATQDDEAIPMIFEKWGFGEWLELYEQLPEFDGPMMNLDPEDLASLFTWLSLWQKTEDQKFHIESQSEDQLELIRLLKEKSEFISLSTTVNEQHLGDQAPLLYMTTAKAYFSEQQEVSEQYELELLIAPLPWMNGKSFMLSSGVFGNQKNEAAMQWLELINRSQPVGSIIHRKTNSQLNSHVAQAVLGQQLQYKLRNKQLFAIHSKWAVDYEHLQKRWKEAKTLELKLESLVTATK